MAQIKDAWFTVKQIDDETFAISEYGHWEKVHSYLLIGEGKAALIDMGLGIDNIKRITDQLTDFPIVVITTHVHWDHTGSHCEFENIYVHKDEEDWMINGIKGLPIEQIRRDVSRDITVTTPISFNLATYTPFKGEPKGLLNDGDEMDLGNRTLIILKKHDSSHSIMLFYCIGNYRIETLWITLCMKDIHFRLQRPTTFKLRTSPIDKEDLPIDVSQRPSRTYTLEVKVTIDSKLKDGRLRTGKPNIGMPPIRGMLPLSHCVREVQLKPPHHTWHR